MHADVTQMLAKWREGDQKALDQLLPLLYDELKRLASARLRGERSGHTLNTTALVHEVYIKLIDVDRVRATDRAHFLATASRQMRRILIDYARRRNAQKRGGGAHQVALDEERWIPVTNAEVVLELDDALQRLEKLYPRQGKAVEMHYFGGLTLEEVGTVLAVSAPTVMRDLRFAHAWLARDWDDAGSSTARG